MRFATVGVRSSASGSEHVGETLSPNSCALLHVHIVNLLLKLLFLSSRVK